VASQWHLSTDGREVLIAARESERLDEHFVELELVEDLASLEIPHDDRGLGEEPN